MENKKEKKDRFAYESNQGLSIVKQEDPSKKEEIKKSTEEDIDKSYTDLFKDYTK